MTVNKITSPITPLELIDKTNEIIDNLGGSGTAPEWGNITGTLSDQTDLQNALDTKQTTTNLVTSISASSTNAQYPSAKCMYDIIGNIETLLSEV